jgi:phosphoglycolate phosphatase
MKTMDLLIFDLDGTLAATGEDLICSVNYTMEAMGLATLAPERIIGFVGDGSRELMLRSLGSEHRNRIEEAMAIFSAYHDLHLLDHTELYPDVVACLDYYKQKHKVVLTNKNQRYSEKILRDLGIMDYFDQIIGGDAWPYMKPDARLVYLLLETFQVAPERTVMIGDGRNDILLARNAGIMSCACLDGLTQRAILLAMEPDFTCESLAALPSLFA